MTACNRHTLTASHAELQRGHRPENSDCNTWFAEYHWHGPQFLVGNLYILVGLLFVALLVALAMVPRAERGPAGIPHLISRPRG